MAETNIPPDFQLKALLASYPELNKEYPSSWFSWSDNPGIKPKMQLKAICHADMRYAAAGHDHLVTAVPKDSKISLKYLRMLINGPFKAFSDLIELVETKDGHYLQCNELKRWPAPVLFNFCIATRVPIEFPKQLEGWASLREEGYPEVLAFLLSRSTGGEKFKNVRGFPDHGHYWFDASADWKKIISGDPDLTGLNYHTSPTSITPTNVIWGKSYDYMHIKSLDDTKTAEFFGFKFPDKSKQIKPTRGKAELGAAFKKIYWNPAEDPQPYEPPMGLGQAQEHINQILNVNQIHMQQNPADFGVWQQVHQAIHDEVAVAAPVVAVDPLVIHIDDDMPDFDEFPDFDEDADD